MNNKTKHNKRVNNKTKHNKTVNNETKHNKTVDKTKHNKRVNNETKHSKTVNNIFYGIYFTINTPRQRRNGRRFANDILKCILVDANCCILIQIPLKFIPNAPIENNLALVQTMAWRRTGHRPLSGPMMTLITGAYMRHYPCSLDGLDIYVLQG